MRDKGVSKSDCDLYKMFHETLARSQNYVQFSCSVVSGSVTPWTEACQASLLGDGGERQREVIW